jgi:2-polyprenyl-3-methyl-5-hydroxy-6-metoxy-1,4-benzoquinol methylase
MSHVDPPKTQTLPAWRTCLDVEHQEAQHYLEHVNSGLIGLIEGTPRRFLDIGCASGAFGAALKEKYPGAHVVGIEAGQGAAAEARKRLDHVVRARIEEVDFAAPELAGQFDAVIVADILEHLVNPWQLLLRMKAALAPGAQVLASIPNARNLTLLDHLVLDGRWTYLDRGLLDVTHLRFFTLAEILQMFAETGYRCETSAANLTPALAPLFMEYRGREKVTLRRGRLTLTDLTQREFYELCAEQFLLRCRAV